MKAFKCENAKPLLHACIRAPNKRQVLILEGMPKRADDRIVKTLGKQGTLKLVEEGWLWNYLLRKMH